MYADRQARPGGLNPGSLGITLVINGALIGALFFAAPDIFHRSPDPILTTYPVSIDPPPAPLPPPPDPERHPKPRLRVDAPIPRVPIPSDDGLKIDPLPFPPQTGDPTGMGTGPGMETGVVDPPKPAPLPFVQPGIDPRYVADFQPIYPPEERRAGHDGKVVVRVLIGIDGRVKQVERVNATSDAFFRTTLDRAMKRWRFKPATRGGIPEVAWRTMSLTFVMKDES